MENKQKLKEKIKAFRKIIKLIEEIDKIEHIKNYFLGYYTYSPKITLEFCYNLFIEDYNERCYAEIERINLIKINNIEDACVYLKLITAIRERIINLNDNTYITIYKSTEYNKENLNSLEFDKITNIANDLNIIYTNYKYVIYKDVCSEYIQKLEEKAFLFLTNKKKKL